MICRVCLKDSSDALQIFDKRGLELNISTILGKHFWFEPRDDDPLSKCVCLVCWYKISQFNKFYEEVEEAHRLLTERFSVKAEKKKKPTVKATPNFSSNSNSTIANEDENMTNHSLDINRILSDSTVAVTLEDKSFSLFATHDDNACQEDDDIYINDDSFNGERFIEKMLNDEDFLDQTPQSKSSDIKLEKEVVKSPERRITRSNNSSKNIIDSSNNSNVDHLSDEASETPLKKKRGRPSKSFKRSLSPIVTNKPPLKTLKPSESKSKETDEPTDTTELKTNDEHKSDDVDEKISKHVKLQCNICGDVKTNFANLKNHMQEDHSCRGYVVCCDRKFYKRTLLHDHIEKHINPDRFKCEECDKVFADKQCVRNHMLLKHQPEENKIYQCEHCEKKFAKPYLLEQHRVTHEERSHICDICQRGFPSEGTLKSHKKLTHSNYGEMCNICAKVIRSRSLFQKHMLEHEGITMPKVQCDKCGSWHKDKYSLQKHKRRHNEEGTEYKCETCGKIAPNRSALLSHIRYVHASERIYSCSVCDKSFKRSINLKEHMARHTGDVLYKCPHCPTTFNSNANMHSHRKKVHPKEFEQARQNRLVAKAESIALTPIHKIAEESAKDMNQANKIDTSLETNQHHINLDDKDILLNSNLPKILTIKSDENGETTQVIVTREDFISDDENGDDDNLIITFT